MTYLPSSDRRIPMNSAKKPKHSRTSFHWEFCVKSYIVDAQFRSLSLPPSQPSPTMIGLSSKPNGPTAGQPNAVIYFYWPGRKIPTKPSAVHNNTLELHYPIGAFGGILQLLQAPVDLYCFYDEDPADPLTPKVGLQQKVFIPR